MGGDPLRGDRREGRDVTARSFAVLGASGLVGGHLARALAADPRYARGTLIGRRVTGPVEEGHVTEVIVDFDRLEGARRHLAVDDLFCCLGTTIKQAGSQEAFRKIDCDIPLAIGREARAAGTRQFLIVTAVGADVASRVFYNRVKGEVEAGLAALDFPGGLQVFHPSILVGHREEPRRGERIAMALMNATRPLFAGGLARYRAIGAEEVARAMHQAAFKPATPGVHVYEGTSLFALAG